MPLQPASTGASPPPTHASSSSTSIRQSTRDYLLGHAGVEPLGLESYRGDKLGDLVVSVATYFPDIHRELHRVNVLGEMVAVELSIQGTFLGPLQTPSGTFEPTG